MSAQVNWAASGRQIYAAGVGDIDTTDGELRLLARPWGVAPDAACGARSHCDDHAFGWPRSDQDERVNEARGFRAVRRRAKRLLLVVALR